MAHLTWDVAIVGGGPAGAACAIALRQTFPALHVGLVESSDYTQLRAGEVLPPLARGLLAHLGVLDQMSGEQGRSACGLASAWGSDELQERDYFYGAAGEGWYLDRCRFDAMLVRKAEALGSTVLLQSSLQEAERDDDGWRLRLSGGEGIAARWVVDATGRKALFARRQGATQQVQDRLMGFLRIVRCSHASSAQTVIEAAPQGWWYTAPLPDGRRVAGLMTDAGLLVANPVYGTPDDKGRFTRNAYHGLVVWSWQQALLAAGLNRQIQRTDLPPAVRARLVAARQTLWAAIDAHRDMASSELWSWGFEKGRYVVVPFGAGAGDADESNAAQLWSSAYLGLKAPARR